jgi:CubicO group peptidase (beta-lactamase class C family)
MNKKDQVLWNQLNDFVPEAMKKKKIPGTVVGLLHKGEITVSGFGVTNVEHPLSVTADTLCQIGSISKTYTATALMRLMEMGKIELDATVQTYAPEFKVADEAATAQATIRHLLTHTGGWVGDFFYDSGTGDDALPKYVEAMAELQQLAPVGKVFSYSNSSFYLAGHIIEKVTGKSLEAALQELVFDPLDLKSTYFKAGDVMTHRFAVGHNIEGGEAKVARPWPLPRFVYPAGGIVCSAHDLLCYAHFHLSKGSTVEGMLKRETLEQMYEPQVTVWENEFRSLGWGIDDTLGTRQIKHTGATTGQVSQLYIVPEHDLALAIFVNADQGFDTTQQVQKWIFKEYLGLDIPEASPIECSAEELESYAGFYSHPRFDIELRLLSGRLVFQATFKTGFPDPDSPPPPQPMPMPMGLCEKDRLLVLDGPAKGDKVDVIRRSDGTIGWLRRKGRIFERKG